jgi:hypothetical protein
MGEEYVSKGFAKYFIRGAALVIMLAVLASIIGRFFI